MRLNGQGDFFREIRREVPAIPLLQLRTLPILTRKRSATSARAALAFNRVIVVIRCRPVVSGSSPGAMSRMATNVISPRIPRFASQE